MAAPAPNILVIRRRYLGDIVLLGNVLRNLKLHWPAARVTVLTEAAYAGVLAMNPDADGVLPFPGRLAQWWSLWWKLRAARFTHVLDFDNRDKTAFITLASGAARRYGLRHGRAVHLPWCYTDREAVPREFLDEHHFTELHHRLLLRAGVPIVTSDVTLQPREAELEFVRGLPELAGLPADRPRVLVHPGSRSEFRVWPPEHFATVCDALVAEGLASVTLVAGPAEAHIVEAIRGRMTAPVTCVSRPLTVPQLGALLGRFDVLLCHDSGPMHVAAAVGTRVVALFGSQSHTIFGPVGAGHTTLSPPLPCERCVAPGVCKREDAYFNYCVRNIAPQRVLAALRSSLGGNDGRVGAGPGPRA